MNRKAVLGIILTLILTSMLELSFHVQQVKAEPKTIRVPIDYPNIQAAIDAANPGDTVFVYNGTYYENAVVDKNDLTLVGQNRSNTIIDGRGTGPVIAVFASSNVTIKEFTIRNSAVYQFGILISGCAYNVVQGNTITSNYIGIGIGDSTSIVIVDNTITNNQDGFHMLRSNENDIIYNIITNNSRGIWSDLTNINNITSNRITKNSVLGIGLYRSSNGAISKNTLINNSIGIKLVGLFSNNNTLFHNNFINNTQQVSSSDCTNILDNGYPSGGNYWSNYNGVDLYCGQYQNETGSDGIGDTPYVIDANNTDNYPLMNIYWCPADVDHDLDVDLYDAVKLLIAYGSEPGDDNWNPHCDIAEPYGQIDLYDAVLLLVNYGKKYS